MKRILYNLLSSLVKTLSGCTIVGKKLNGFGKTLFYERSRYLAFLSQSRRKMHVKGLEAEMITALTYPFTHCTFLIEVQEETKKEVFEYFQKNHYQCIWIDRADIVIRNADEIPDFANLIFRKPTATTQ